MPKYIDLLPPARIAVDAAARKAFQERMADSGVAGAEGAMDEFKEAIASDPKRLEAAIAAHKEGRRIT